MEEHHTFISSDGTLLSGYLHINPGSDRIAIITHPYAPLGGNCDNHVVLTAADIMFEAGYSTFRLDLRGAGNSKGRTSWTGQSEVYDVIVGAEFATKKMKQLGIDSVKIVLIGYSFGSMITCQACLEIPNVIGLVSISYPSSVMWFLTFFHSSMYIDGLAELASIPKLFISGNNDTFSSVSGWKSIVEQSTAPKELVVVPGDHFWMSRASISSLSTALKNWLSTVK